MKSYNLQQQDDNVGFQHVFEFFKLVGVLLGMVCIVIGLVFAVKIFMLVYGVLETPENMLSLLERWAEALGGEELKFNFEGSVVPLANVVAAGILGSSALILALISLGLITAGAKLVSWILFDRETIKRILVQTFGKSREENKKGENH
jgi:hypothetical protein